jgi:hypothetical protein
VFGSRQRQGVFLVSAPRPSLGPTNSPIQWVPWALSPEIKHLEREADHSRPSTAEVKNAWSYTSIPPYVLMVLYLLKHRIHLHGVVLS